MGKKLKCKNCGRILDIKYALENKKQYSDVSTQRGVRWPALGAFLKSLKKYRKHIVAAAVTVLLAGAYLASTNKPPASTKVSPAREKVTTPQVPAAPALPPVSLPTGTNIRKPRGGKGLGSLQVINGTNLDAVVKLVEAGDIRRVCRYVYVRSGDTVDIRNISIGNYRARFRLGMDWDKTKSTFRRSARQAEFIDEIKYDEYEEENGIRYSTYRITLHPVQEGKAKTKAISDEDFDSEYLVEDTSPASDPSIRKIQL